MKALLVADREPYLHYRTRPEEQTGSGSAVPRIQPPITIEVASYPDAEKRADLYIVPAALFTGMVAPERPHPAFAYGPVTLMDAAFGAGCVDYLRDPWILRELEARSARYEVVRVTLCGSAIALSSGRMTIDETEPILLRHGEYLALRLLSINRDSCVTREFLEYALWGGTRPKSRSLDVLVSTLRQVLEKHLPGSASRIKSFRGYGYVLETDTCG